MSSYNWHRVGEKICLESITGLPKGTLERHELIKMLKELDPDTRVLSSNELAYEIVMRG